MLLQFSFYESRRVNAYELLRPSFSTRWLADVFIAGCVCFEQVRSNCSVSVDDLTSY